MNRWSSRGILTLIGLVVASVGFAPDQVAAQEESYSYDDGHTALYVTGAVVAAAAVYWFFVRDGSTSSDLQAQLPTAAPPILGARATTGPVVWTESWPTAPATPELSATDPQPKNGVGAR